MVFHDVVFSMYDTFAIYITCDHIQYKADAWKIRWKVYCNKITEALTIINIIILLEDTMTTHFYVIACVIRVNLA